MILQYYGSLILYNIALAVLEHNERSETSPEISLWKVCYNNVLLRSYWTSASRK